ncbi:MAG TPA: GDSL-type esterase/lipase family protein [Thermoanaerobaculia bacterium]|nr:GDSL-type esterase/lipase family protein [Thermoanaerobaculia bacterium]
MNPRKLAIAAVFLGLVPAPAAAQTLPRKYICFGDSITEGRGDDTTRARLGYPPRLEVLLQAAGVSATVVNEGKGGERTPDALDRVDSVLAQGSPGDYFLLMEGTNDISRAISPETTIFNLDEMARRAEVKTMLALHATVIPRKPASKVDADNIVNDAFNGRVRNLAGVRQRREADPYEVFRTTPNLFTDFYVEVADDPVGHPNPAGYDLLARVFFNSLQGIDTVPPVTGIVSPANGTTGVAAEPKIDVDVWDFGTGIDLANTFLLVNGTVTPAVPTGNAVRARLSFQPVTPLTGLVSVGLRSRDLATPPNTVDREILHFTVAGFGGLQGDLNLDNRVDGADLVIFALHFGAIKGDPAYSSAVDLNADGKIDGLDLAILASNFGKSATP